MGFPAAGPIPSPPHPPPPSFHRDINDSGESMYKDLGGEVLAATDPGGTGAAPCRAGNANVRGRGVEGSGVENQRTHTTSAGRPGPGHVTVPARTPVIAVSPSPTEVGVGSGIDTPGRPVPGPGPRRLHGRRTDPPCATQRHHSLVVSLGWDLCLCCGDAEYKQSVGKSWDGKGGGGGGPR